MYHPYTWSTKNSAPKAAAELETELERITGFSKGPPEATETSTRVNSTRSQLRGAKLSYC